MHTGAFAQSVDFHDDDIETEEEVERVFHDWSCSADEEFDTVEAKSRSNFLEDETIGQAKARGYVVLSAHSKNRTHTRNTYRGRERNESDRVEWQERKYDHS